MAVRSQFDNTGRLRPGQPAPRDTATLWTRIARRAGGLALILAIVVSLVSVLTLSPHAKIEPASAANTAYQTTADQLLASSFWNHNKLTIDAGGIKRQLMTRFPNLADVSVTVPLLAHRPIIYVQPAKALMVVAANNGAFVVDQNGRALMPSANLPTAGKLPQVVDQSGLPLSVGRQVLTSDDVNFIQTVLGELAAKHVEVSSMVLPVSSRELDVYVAGQPYLVKFNLASNDARQQAGTYLAAAAELQREHVTPAHYIDVRVDGRAYYQ